MSCKCVFFLVVVKTRQKHNFFSNFWIGTEHLILFGRHVFTDVFWFSKLLALLNYLCVFSTSLVVQRQTPLEIRQKHSRILLYMHRFRIVSSVNSWVARLLLLPPTFRFVRLGVQRENHCDCASSSMVMHLSGESRKLTITISVNWSTIRLLC